MEMTEQNTSAFFLCPCTLLSPAALPKALYDISKALGALVKNGDYSSVEGNLHVTLHSASVVFHIMQRCIVSCLQLIDIGVGRIPGGKSPFYQYIQAYYLVGEMVRVRMEYGDGLEDTSSSSSYSVATGAVHLSSKSCKHFMQFLTDVLILMRHTVEQC